MRLSPFLRGLIEIEQVPYGIRTSLAHRQAIRAQKSASRRNAITKGVLALDGNKTLKHSLMLTQGISWGNAMQVMKLLNMHEKQPMNEEVIQRKNEINKFIKAIVTKGASEKEQGRGASSSTYKRRR